VGTIRRLLWLLSNWWRRFTIVIDRSADASYAEELREHCDRLQTHDQYKGEAQKYFYGLLILIRAVNLLRSSVPRYYSFRRASDAECRQAAADARATGKAGIERKLDENGGIGLLVAEDDQPLVFHFFERYGYRFTLLLNLKTYQGTVHHIERLKTYQSGASGVLATLLDETL